nr:hypothetical protein [Thiocapsa imhoffii]
MSTLKAFSDKDRAYHAYQARQNDLREQRSIQRHFDELRAETEQQRAALEQQQAEMEQQQAALVVGYKPLFTNNSDTTLIQAIGRGDRGQRMAGYRIDECIHRPEGST